MNSRHWSDEELLEHLYGVKGEDEHFESCVECSARARKIALARFEATRPPEVPYDLLAAQRRNIYRRLDSPPGGWHPMRWAVAAVALAVMFTLALLRVNEMSRVNELSRVRGDDQFYTELSSLEQNSTPRAVQAIEALVHDDVQE